MTEKELPKPMPYTRAGHLLNPLRGLILSPLKLVKRLNLRPNSMVLELGPGPGYFSPELARAAHKGRLVLVDVQQEMLDMAKDRLDRESLDNVEFRRGDGVAIPAEDGEFDLALVVSMLGEVPDRQACLKELHRVLKSGGMLSVTEHKIKDPDFIPRAELTREVKSTGFKISEVFGGLFCYTVNFVKAGLYGVQILIK